MLNLKHVTAAALVLLSLMYLYEGDMSKQASIDYALSVLTVVLSVYMYGRLLRQTRKETKR